MDVKFGLALTYLIQFTVIYSTPKKHEKTFPVSMNVLREQPVVKSTNTFMNNRGTNSSTSSSHWTNFRGL